MNPKRGELLSCMMASLLPFGLACSGGGTSTNAPPAANLPPTVIAGLDQSVVEGAAVTLSATASDPDGTIASYQWAQTGGPSVSLSGSTTAQASFIAPQVTTATTLTFTITVTDNRGASAYDSVIVTTNDSAPATGYKYLVQNTAYIAPEYGTAPAKFGTATNSVTGATLKRLTNSSETAAAAKGSLVVYSRFSPTNSAKNKIIIHGEDSTSAWVVDLATGAILRNLLHSDGTSIGEVNEIRWDGSNSFPSRIYYVRDLAFYQQDVATGISTLVRDFASIAGGPYPNGAFIFNDVEGDSSNDSRYWCWMVLEITTGGPYPVKKIFTYDKQTDTVLGIRNPSDFGKTGSIPRPNMVEISPLGTKAVIHFDRAFAGNRDEDIGTVLDGPHAWPLTLTGTPVKVSIDATHAGWSLDASGAEWFVSQNNVTDFIEARRLSDGTTIHLLYHGDLGWNNGFHFGKFHTKRGWAFVSTYSSSDSAVADNQLFMVKLQDMSAGIVMQRVSPTYIAYPGNDAYRNEGQAALSMDGNSIYWTCNWGGAFPYREAVGIDLPSDWDTH
ncbi:MAG: hypothetical protein IPQ13_07325 [Holophagaceae bacterium]|nr:hypothetical protein [Holophagaceae bacterium]